MLFRSLPAVSNGVETGRQGAVRGDQVARLSIGLPYKRSGSSTLVKLEIHKCAQDHGDQQQPLQDPCRRCHYRPQRARDFILLDVIPNKPQAGSAYKHQAREKNDLCTFDHRLILALQHRDLLRDQVGFALDSTHKGSTDGQCHQSHTLIECPAACGGRDEVPNRETATRTYSLAKPIELLRLNIAALGPEQS